MHQTSKMKALIQDWRWIVGVSLLLAIPTYGFTSPMRYAVTAHIVATLLYLGLLLLFGQGFLSLPAPVYFRRKSSLRSHGQASKTPLDTETFS
jgi:hypothetical protein